jgi:NADH-quinone oxidoreductase subunit C
MTAPPSIASEIASLGGIPVSFSRKQEVIHPTLAQYFDAIAALKGDSFETCSDLCGVDYLSPRDARSLPGGITPQRFEVVVVLLSLVRHARLRVRVQVPEHDPLCPSIFTLYPGSENMEREAYDMFGIVFDGHPGLTRILMPDDWDGFPQRKDYPLGGIPVQYKGATIPPPDERRAYR